MLCHPAPRFASAPLVYAHLALLTHHASPCADASHDASTTSHLALLPRPCQRTTMSTCVLEYTRSSPCHLTPPLPRASNPAVLCRPAPCRAPPAHASPGTLHLSPCPSAPGTLACGHAAPSPCSAAHPTVLHRALHLAPAHRTSAHLCLTPGPAPPRTSLLCSATQHRRALLSAPTRTSSCSRITPRRALAPRTWPCSTLSVLRSQRVSHVSRRDLNSRRRRPPGSSRPISAPSGRGGNRILLHRHDRAQLPERGGNTVGLRKRR